MTRRKLITLAALLFLLIGTVRIVAPQYVNAQESDDQAEEQDREDVAPSTTQTPTLQPSTTLQNANTAPAANLNANTATTNANVATPAAPTYTSVDTADEAGVSTDAELTPVISKAFPWAWVITRAAGITSYILLGLLSLTGLLLSTGTFFRAFEPATAWSIHRAIASSLLFAVLTHVGSLLFDKFINLHILDVLVPFVSSYRPLLVTLGIAGFYLLLLVLATSLYTMNRWPRFWRIVHYFSFVMFISIFFHGILIGTDAKVWWVRLIYWGTAALVVGLGAYRLWWKHHQESNSVIT
jgi:hypothetical protein